MFRALIFSLLFVGLPNLALGSEYGNSYLHDQCKKQSPACFGYVVGVLEFEQELVQDGVYDEPAICLLPNANPNELMSLVFAYLSNNKDRWNESTITNIGLALFDEHNCHGI